MAASRGPRGHRSGALSSVASVTELVVVQATGKLRLLQMCCNVLVGHLLETGLEEVGFLRNENTVNQGCPRRLAQLGAQATLEFVVLL